MATGMIYGVALSSVLGLPACGGDGDSEATGGGSSSVEIPVAAPIEGPPEVPDPAPAAPSFANCTVVPARPAMGATRSVAEFGARPGDTTDDTAAIQLALDGLKSGQTLVFPPGRYLTSERLHARVPGTMLRGDGATLHATNPDDQALVIEADNISVYSFTFTAVTDVRRSAPRHARVAVWFENADRTLRTIRNTVIQGNTIVNAGSPGSPEANSASSAGIVLLHADGFLIADNTVVRSLADGIHITSGSRNGRVLRNTVRENGDDMIAVVSYAGDGPAVRSSAQALKQDWDTRVESKLNRNILIADNSVSGQYWGRGITVVGGRAITIQRNRLDNIPLAAGILLAREAGYESFGVDDVRVADNTLSNLQNQSPPYDVGGKFASHARTGHGAVELHASLFDDEAADPLLKAEFSLRNITLTHNTVLNASVPAVRAGVGFSGVLTGVDPVSGAALSRTETTSVVEALSLEANRFNGVTGSALSLHAGMAAGGLHCEGNSRDGQAYSVPACRPLAGLARGANMSCSATGQML